MGDEQQPQPEKPKKRGGRPKGAKDLRPRKRGVQRRGPDKKPRKRRVDRPDRKQRKPLLADPERRDRLRQALRLGAPFKFAANYAGLSTDTFYRYMYEANKALEKRRRDPSYVPTKRERYCVKIFNMVSKEVSTGVMRDLMKIDEVGHKHGFFSAVAWKLERRHEEFRMNSTVAVTDPGGKPLGSGIPFEVLRDVSQRMDLLEKRDVERATAADRRNVDEPARITLDDLRSVDGGNGKKGNGAHGD